MNSSGKKTFLFLFLALLLSCCGVRENWQTATLLYFDTICEVQIICLPDRFGSYQQEVHRVFTEIEKCFSPESADFTSPLVLELFETSMKFYHDSNGFFDITVGPLTKLWDLSGKKSSVPSQQEIKETLKYIGMDKVKIENNSLKLISPMKLDWGGIAKGYGIDLASYSLIKMGVSSGFINAGGDLYCWGKNPSRDLWRIGIKHPREKGYIGILSITDLAVATSGDYQRYFIIDNVRYHHLLNPFTGYPSQGKQSVTVIGPKTTYCDALSTALFVSSHPERVIEKYPEYGAIVVDSEGKVRRVGKLYPFSLQ